CTPNPPRRSPGGADLALSDQRKGAKWSASISPAFSALATRPATASMQPRRSRTAAFECDLSRCNGFAGGRSRVCSPSLVVGLRNVGEFLDERGNRPDFLIGHRRVGQTE